MLRRCSVWSPRTASLLYVSGARFIRLRAQAPLALPAAFSFVLWFVLSLSRVCSPLSRRPRFPVPLHPRMADDWRVSVYPDALPSARRY